MYTIGRNKGEGGSKILKRLCKIILPGYLFSVGPQFRNYIVFVVFYSDILAFVS